MFLHRLLKYFQWPHNIPSIGQTIIFLTVHPAGRATAPCFTVINNAGGKRFLSLLAISLGPVPRTGINGSKSRSALKAFDVPAKRLSARGLPARSPVGGMDVSGPAPLAAAPRGPLMDERGLSGLFSQHSSDGGRHSAPLFAILDPLSSPGGPWLMASAHLSRAGSRSVFLIIRLHKDISLLCVCRKYFSSLGWVFSPPVSPMAAFLHITYVSHLRGVIWLPFPLSGTF